MIPCYKYSFSHPRVIVTVAKDSESLHLGLCLSHLSLFSMPKHHAWHNKNFVCLRRHTPIKTHIKGCSALQSFSGLELRVQSVEPLLLIVTYRWEKWGSLAYASEDRLYLEIAPKSINNPFTKAVGVFWMRRKYFSFSQELDCFELAWGGGCPASPSDAGIAYKWTEDLTTSRKESHRITKGFETRSSEFSDWCRIYSISK